MVRIFMALALYILIWVLYFMEGISLDTVVIVNLVFFLLFPFFVDHALENDDDDDEE